MVLQILVPPRFLSEQPKGSYFASLGKGFPIYKIGLKITPI